MKIALVIFDKINLLNLARIRTFLESLESKPEIKICAFKSEISDEYGLKILPQIYGESLYGYDALILPDGSGALTLRHDEIFLSWIKSASRARVKVGFDLGTLVLGAAGFLEGKKACVRAGYKNALAEYCEFDSSAVCVSRDVVTICGFDGVSGAEAFTAENLRILEEILSL